MKATPPPRRLPVRRSGLPASRRHAHHVALQCRQWYAFTSREECTTVSAAGSTPEYSSSTAVDSHRAAVGSRRI